jgi:subtilisin
MGQQHHILSTLEGFPVWPIAGALLLGVAGLAAVQRRGRQFPPRERKIVTFWKDVPLDQGRVLLRSLGGEVVRELPLINGVVCEFPRATVEFYRALAVLPQVMDVEDDGLMHILCWWRRPAVPVAQTVPWGVERVGAPRAWPVSRGRGVRVAVIDTGVNANHPDLKEAVRGGVNVIDPGAPPADDNGHGTHVAGIIGARDNQVGVVGVAPEAELYAVKAFDGHGSGAISNIISGLQWCLDNGMRVVNMSFGGNKNRALGRALQAALDAGLVLVAAAGNNGRPDSVDYPASHPGVIAVSALDAGDTLARYSSRGPEVDLAAPGSRILSTYGDGYRELSGTSMAAPHVSGVAALVLSRWPGVTGDDVERRLKESATPLPSLGRDEQGAGLVNAPAALGIQG